MTLPQQDAKSKQEEHEFKESRLMMMKVLDLVLITLFFSCV